MAAVMRGRITGRSSFIANASLLAFLLFCSYASDAFNACDTKASRRRIPCDLGSVSERDISRSQCEAKGCCWDFQDHEGPTCFQNIPGSSASGACVPFAPRKACGPSSLSQQDCLTVGCCWYPFPNEPSCFQRTASLPFYTVTALTPTKLGMQLTLTSSNVTMYGPNISPLVVDITMETNERLHVKIYDPKNKRWEVPESASPVPPPPSTKPSSPLYKISTATVGQEFWFAVSRITGETIFNTSATSAYSGMQFADQYLEMSTSLPLNPFLYGLGEHVNPFRIPRNNSLTLWNTDISTPPNTNLYGSHPFYLEMRTPGKAHGVFLRSSNGMDALLGNSSLTYRVIGGIFDWYFFMGPGPESVVQQYQEVIGRPYLPPYWGLGFHNCRFGYRSIDVVEEVVANYSAAMIPLETMWTDIDYADGEKDFTLDPVRFPPSKVKSFVQGLHQKGQHYIVIVDPGLHNQTGYAPWDQGLKEDIFLKDKKGSVFIGKVWPGTTAFPDFLHPKTADFWEEQVATFHDTLVPVDGMWIDMNEISNFCDGACEVRDKEKPLGGKGESPQGKGSFKFDPNKPPYAINNREQHSPLNSHTTDMDCVHYGGVLEYNAHNIYGLLEAQASCRALEKIRKERAFVISRSTFPGSGQYTGHWTGDNHATFDYLHNSITGMLNFQLFGIPLVGSDICGFHENTTEELCSRWVQVGAFYPFSRDHNDRNTIPQELYRWNSVAAIARVFLTVRYLLLPYYYTLFYLAHRPVSPNDPPSATVTRPLYFEFPSDVTTYDIDRQFLVGPGLLVSPVLEQGARSVTAYLPEGMWYEFYNLTATTKTGKTWVQVDAPLDRVPLHIRGGVILPVQDPGNTTAVSRSNNFGLIVALDNNGSASGVLYIDDGVSLQPSQWILINYTVSSAKLTATVTGPGYKSPPLGIVEVAGVQGKPTKAFCNGKPVLRFFFDEGRHLLVLEELNATMDRAVTIQWL